MKNLFEVTAVRNGYVAYKCWQTAKSATEAVSIAKMYAGNVGKATWRATPAS